MKSIIPSKDIIGVEVTNITKHGLWLLTRDNELFISLKEFPRFRDASLSNIMNVDVGPLLRQLLTRVDDF